VRQPAPGETNYLVAQKSEAGIPGAVLLERRPGSVRVPAIELGHGDDTVLARSQARNYGVRIAIGALPTHVGR
jgi:hypothetical protein